jgi:trehalose-phosphatase
MRHALQVNPWNIFGVARAIDYALRMSHDERKERHDELYRQIVNHTSHHWAISLVKQILLRLHSEQTAHLTPALDKPLLKERFDKAKKRLILMDYDGTMTPIVKDPEAAVPSKRLLEALDKLGSDERNVIWVVSGRDDRFLSKHLGHLKVGFSAEHGGYVREPGSQEWQNLTKELDMSWMPAIRQVFEYYTERTSGSWIEQKKSSITWHYRAADPDYGIFQAKECQAHLDNFAAQEKFAVEIMVGKKNLEVRPLAVNKGEIVKRITHSHPDAEFVFCCGDDRTDEDMMKFFCSLTPVNGEAPLMANNTGGVASQSASGTRLSLPRLSTSGSQSETTIVGCASAAQEEQETAPLIMSAPAPLSSSRGGGGEQASGGVGGSSAVKLALTKRGIFTTAIGAASKKTLARWHLDGPQSVIAVLATMAGLEDADAPLPSAHDEEEAADAAREEADGDDGGDGNGK